MKKEIKALIESEDATLQINELFKLRHWTLNKETDLLSRESDYLELEMTNKNGNVRSGSIRIESRTFPEIQEEIETAMATMMSQYQQNLLSRWRGGLIG